MAVSVFRIKSYLFANFLSDQTIGFYADFPGLQSTVLFLTIPPISPEGHTSKSVWKVIRIIRWSERMGEKFFGFADGVMNQFLGHSRCEKAC